MATVKPLEPEKPVDRVGFEPLMLAVRKARAMASVLDQLAEGALWGETLVQALTDRKRPEETLDWLRHVVAEALHGALDDIEADYRKLGTNLLAKEAAAIRKPKDGA